MMEYRNIGKGLRRLAAALVLLAGTLRPADACTGISFFAADGSRVLARTTEWGGSILDSRYVIVPRGHSHTALAPDGGTGMQFQARYGYVGISVDQPDFVVEGMNEAGLSAGLFFFPGYGGYEAFDPACRDASLPDMQLVSWMLAGFSTVEEVIAAFPEIRVVALSPEAGTVHWRIGDRSGRQVVLEIVDGKPRFYENELGVLTNSPGFDWQMLNLNNYVNLAAGTAAPNVLNGNVSLRSFGAGSSMLGLPGDVTPPSRFVRAAFYAATAPQCATGEETVLMSFQILNNFDIPIGVEHPKDRIPAGLTSATQWTTASDLHAGRFYYRTWRNATIRCIDLQSIRFDKVAYRSEPLDRTEHQPIEMIRVK